MDYRAFREAAARVRPSARQLAFLQEPFYAFVHFGVNTYTGREWGDGMESPALFNPAELDCDQWVRAVKAAGMTGLVLTAKHHDGFCLWPSRYTEHSVKNSPWRGGRGDVVREAAEACRRGGIRFGFYLSPWDRNSSLYGTDAYNDYYKAQLTELLTQYGDIFYVWFDGACGEGPNGRKQQYDFDGYIELIRRYQPNAAIFNDAGPDIRWIGNESGTARYAEWAVVPHELCFRAELQTEGPLVPGSLEGIYNTWQDVGSLSVIQYSKGLCFCPAEVDMSIRPGWFFHPEEEPHSVERLLRTYLTSVGGNATFHLNIPPMPSGRLDERDVRRLAELGEALRAAFGREVAGAQVEQREISATQCVLRVTLPRETTVRHVELRESIADGQRVEGFLLQRMGPYGTYEPLYQGATIGARRICPLGEGVALRELELVVTAARGPADGLSVRLYEG